jgi:4-hydroxy-tetrahydrodipicolinate reductase
MKLGIIGYGKMGKAIERLADQYGFSSLVVIDNEEDWVKKHHDLKNCDVAIEFSTPQTVLSNLLKCFDIQLPIVSGTTGWKDKKAEFLSSLNNKSISFIYGSNFSIGANIFFKLNQYLAQQMKSHSQYAVSIEETHHLRKKDAPSGTALTIQQGILLQYENNPIIPITSHREDEVVGEHLVNYSSIEDIVSIKHNALTRDAIAHGALKAAVWLIKQPGSYEFEEVFELL